MKQPPFTHYWNGMRQGYTLFWLQNKLFWLHSSGSLCRPGKWAFKWTGRSSGHNMRTYSAIQPAFLVKRSSNLEHLHRNTWKILTRKAASFGKFLGICSLYKVVFLYIFLQLYTLLGQCWRCDLLDFIECLCFFLCFFISLSMYL